MPNHVINQLSFKATKDVATKILTAIAQRTESGEIKLGTIDFNRIIPMPQELDIEASSTTFQAAEVYLTLLNPEADWLGKKEEKMLKEDFDRLLATINRDHIFTKHTGTIQPDMLTERNLGKPVEEMIDRGKIAVENVQKFGHSTWYEWRTDPDNWNTKWNAYDCETDRADEGILRFQTAWSAPHPVIRKLSEMYPEVHFIHEWADEDIGYNCGKAEYQKGFMIGSFWPEQLEAAVAFAEGVWYGGEE